MSPPATLPRPPSPPAKTPVAATHRRLGRRAFAARSHASAPSATRWSWLHATACSSALVAAGAYAHGRLGLQFDAVVVLPWRSLLVLVALALWAAALALLRALGVHAPLRRLLEHALARSRVAHRRRSFRIPRRRRASTAEPEIDETDLLVVTALAAEPRRAHPRRASGAALSPPPSTVSSTSSRESSETVDVDDEQDAQIVLHPREGATGGRHQSNHIIVDDPYVSRYHFEIGYDPLEKEYFLQDLGSTTGTFVFLKPDVPKRLGVDDRVRLGDSEFEVVAIDCNASTGTPFLRLQFTEGPLRGVGQTLGRTPVTLGRRSSNALCITDDASISGRHSSIAYLGDGFYLTDLQSTNGTALRLSASGVASARRFLMHGDVFGVGANRFLVEYAHELELQDKHRAVLLEETEFAAHS